MTATSRFEYDLPTERIAQEPVEPRDAARLLVDHGPGRPVGHQHVADLPDLLGPGDVLVVNDARVLAARLHLRKETGGQAEVLLLEPETGEPSGEGWWQALARPGRRLPPGTLLRVEGRSDVTVEVGGSVPDGDPGVRLVRLRRDGAPVVAVDDVVAMATELGEVPLPPYITTPLAAPDRYQTVYSRRPVSAAAPTAGLHLTEAVLDRCRTRGVEVVSVELAVGLGTFRPMTTTRVEDHEMHAEAYRVPEETWAACERAEHVVAVGTTTVRALESAAAHQALVGRTDLFVHGSYPFAVVDALLTNFHLPRSSLLALVDAFVGGRWRDLYDEAMAEGYRFLSFGDAMFVSRADDPRRPQTGSPTDAPSSGS